MISLNMNILPLFDRHKVAVKDAQIEVFICIQKTTIKNALEPILSEQPICNYFSNHEPIFLLVNP